MIAYLDLPSGISGDMFLSCLIDAGWPLDQLTHAISQLNLPSHSWQITSQKIMKGPLAATYLTVSTDESHSHRNLHDISSLISSSSLHPHIQKTAIAVFTRLAHAEASVHGTTIDKIHFHEVGALDAIIDIVGSVAGLHALNISQLFSSPLILGSGWTNSQHGQIPLPAPATLHLLAQVNAPTRPAPAPGEWVTPTGAALLAQLASFSQPPIAISRIGTGAGTKSPPWPNIARLWLGQPISPAPTPHSSSPLLQLQSNIDDMNPQLYPVLSQQLLDQGAKDVWFTPIHMKKGRPGILLNVLTDPTLEPALAQTILLQTTTLGVRALPVSHRHEAQRQLLPVSTPFGSVHAKIKLLNNLPISATPEFEDCRQLAQKADVSVKQVLDAASTAANLLLQQLQSSPPTYSPTNTPSSSPPKP